MSLQAVSIVDKLTEGQKECATDAEKKQVARAFLLICCTNFFSKFADLLASPKITLTWLMQALGAPAFAISLIVPIREAGSMLPQLLLAGPVASRPRKQRLYQAGTVFQALAIFGVVLTALSFTGLSAAVLIVILVTLFSLGRCLCSLSSKAVLGAVIPKSMRGQTTGWSATIAGLSSCAVAGYLLMQSSTKSISTIVVLLLIACACWLLASLVYGFIDEPASDSDDDKTRSTSLKQRLSLLHEDSDLAKFITVRALYISSALVAPYYILLSGNDESGIRVLGGLLLAGGLANLLSSVVWGRLSDRSSRRTMILSGFLVFLLGTLTLGIYLVEPDLLHSSWLVPLIFFGLQISHQGVRVARKTYIVDMANDETRVDYVALSNSIIGALLLATGILLGVLSTFFEPIWLIVILSLMSLAGALLGRGLREL